MPVTYASAADAARQRRHLHPHTRKYSLQASPSSATQQLEQTDSGHTEESLSDEAREHRSEDIRHPRSHQPHRLELTDSRHTEESLSDEAREHRSEDIRHPRSHQPHRLELTDSRHTEESLSDEAREHRSEDIRHPRGHQPHRLEQTDSGHTEESLSDEAREHRSEDIRHPRSYQPHRLELTDSRHTEESLSDEAREHRSEDIRHPRSHQPHRLELTDSRRTEESLSDEAREHRSEDIRHPRSHQPHRLKLTGLSHTEESLSDEAREHRSEDIRHPRGHQPHRLELTDSRHTEESLSDEAREHRSEDIRHPRSHQPHRGSTVHVGRKDGGDKVHNILPDSTYKKMYDHSPHAVFVQLDELLSGADGEAEWQETARWIKYEEDVEEGSERWGRPHVASLSFHSLLNLRRCLETGVVLLDLDEKDLPGVAYRVVESMVDGGLIEEDDKPVVMRSLLLRHKHVHEDRGFRFSISAAGRKHSSYTSLQSLWLEDGAAGAGGARCSMNRSLEDGKWMIYRTLIYLELLMENLSEAKRRRSSAALGLGASRFGGDGEARKKSSAAVLDARELEHLTAAAAQTSQDEVRRPQNESIMRRIPGDAEATTVLVGAVGFLEQPTIAFVRLAQGIYMPSITEVPVPVRFMFVLLGPAGADLDYHEVGRSISTLMANPAFHDIAYKADDRRELLSAINDFLDDSIVLPPGDWDRQALLPLDELRAKSAMIRRRKQDALQRKRASIAPVPEPLSEEKKALLAAEAGGEPRKEPDDPLARTGRLFGGVIRDIRRRYPHYLSDFKEALNGQCAAATIFMYFAALSSAITFGGLLAEKTEGQIGISETLVFTCAGGVLFALAAGQPMMITGATGPLLLLDTSLYEFCKGYGFDFLSARMYAGMWMVVIALAVASVEGSAAVKKITRFTEDIFAFLISLIFISEPITNLLGVYRNHPLIDDYCFGSDVSVANGTDVAAANGANGATVAAAAALAAANVADLAANATDIATNATDLAASNFTGLFRNVTDALNGTDVAVANDTLAGVATTAARVATQVVPRPNTALFCTILCLSTFIIAYYLRIFRNGKFLGRSARRALGDFGVPIAIVFMVGVSAVVPVWTETLRVPEGLSPTANRSWLVALNPGMNTIPFWAALAMALPALMVYIIVFMETHIAELIIDKPERRLRKGSGFHMDIVIMAFVNAMCGFFGAPWQCVATVRSVSHVSALTVMSTTHAPGEKPYVVEVKEQRLTGLLVSILVGISVLAATWLRLVPMSVLFGVFLYMGISALNGIQFWDRFILLFKPVKHHPQVPYVRRVPTLRMHLYTLIQLAGICILYAVKSSKFSLALPFFLVMMVPLRMTLSYVFTPLQLRALDGAQKDIDKDDEPDFYEEAPLPG
ncbi:HCO3- transporter family domain-containing protein [Phthorimaea operculella]|nr:HCO3- transporter family domain-containing protein [Phthorimaea operculella]